MDSLPPGSIMLLGALAIPFVQGRLRKVWVLGLPIASLVHLLWFHPAGHTTSFVILGQELTPIRVDKLSLVWGYVFHLAAILASIFAQHVRDRVQHFAATLYAAASLAAVFAGDLLTLFVYWELTAVTSVFLIWASPARHAAGTGMRYLMMHVGSGVLLLSGAILLLVERGSLSFGAPDEIGMFQGLSSWGQILLLIGFGVKAAFPLLHCWLPDAYPTSTATGTVFLSAFTTKMAIYALARGFAGCDVLIGVGCVMAIFPLIHATLADDLRRTLAHVLNNQLGFMVVAIGVGTPLAISGASAQAFAHVIYKGLLFMAMGAVLYRTGTTRQSELGGLARMMPWTCGFCLVGALSVLPLNCGFVSKALVLSAVADAHLDLVWIVLIVGAVGAFLTAGIKVPYFTFFARPYPGGDEVGEAPRNMLVAMGLSAALCLLMGMAPALLYQLLPYSVEDYHVYTFSHVVTQMQLVLFTTLGFVFAVNLGLYPQPVTGTLLDIDWFYRQPLPASITWLRHQLAALDSRAVLERIWARAWQDLAGHCSEAGVLGRSVSTNVMAIFAMILLAIYLLVY